jgi:hypothetical protein
MASLPSQTNINLSRYFFATQEAGEQTLNTETQVSGNLTDFFVSISGPAGNSVQINQMPDIIGTVTTGGEEMLYSGTASTYKTLSSISASAVGTSISIDRTAGSGITTIEAYAGNGSFGGFEFLGRGVDSALISTPIDNYMKGIGREGALAVLGASGTLVAGGALITPVVTSLSDPDKTGAGTGVFSVNDLSGVNSLARWSFYKFGDTTGGEAGTNLALAAYNDDGNFIAPAMTLDRKTASVAQINQYEYPQKLLSTVGVANQTGVSVPTASPTVIYTLSNADLVPGAIYSTDIGFTWEVGPTGGGDTWIELGVRLGGNGSFNYDVPQYIPSGGTGGIFISNSVSQMTDMGSSNTDIDIIAYHQNSNAISISTNTITGGVINYLKMVT